MEVSSIAEQLYFTTVRVETEDESGEKGVGTSFIFNYKSEDNAFPFLVTNKHVVSKKQRASLTLPRAHQGEPLLGVGYRVNIGNFESIWYGHPKANVDVTVVPLAPLVKRIKEAGVDIFFRGIGSELVPSEDALKTFDAIEELVFIGYPIGIWDAKNLLPVVRKGITGSPITIDFQGEPQFLIDASIFPGSSGSPVFLYNAGSYPKKTGGTVIGTRLFFLGVIASVFFQEDVNQIRTRYIPITDVPLAVSRQMIDLGIVFKASTIVETIRVFLEERGQLV